MGKGVKANHREKGVTNHVPFLQKNICAINEEQQEHLAVVMSLRGKRETEEKQKNEKGGKSKLLLVRGTTTRETRETTRMANAARASEGVCDCGRAQRSLQDVIPEARRRREVRSMWSVARVFL